MKLSLVLVWLAICTSVVSASSPEKKEAKAEAKARKQEAKAQKKQGKHAKHLVKDSERIAKGEVPEHHEVADQPVLVPPVQVPGAAAQQPYQAPNQAPSPETYMQCVQFVQQEIAQKEMEQQKHTVKDQMRIAKGEVPEHTDETSMTKDYQHDVKFDVNRICGPPPMGIPADTGLAPQKAEEAEGNIGLRPADKLALNDPPEWSTPVLSIAFLSMCSLAFVAYMVLPKYSANGPAEESLLDGSDDVESSNVYLSA